MLSVCRLEPSKRVSWILRALAALEHAPEPLSERVDWVLDIVGDGSELNDLRHETRQLRLDRRVNFHGRVSDTRLEELYHATRLSLIPAIQGWGLPALESLLRRTPVVLHEQSGVTEILRDSPWVELIRDSGGSDFAAAIERMVGRLRDGTLAKQSLPVVPSDAEWAQAVCSRCGWI
jgi:glycosyltransferase involved in cell wall biosynthesis